MSDVVQGTFTLGAPPWQTFDPFLFCVHHRDDYPAGTEGMGAPPALLAGRDLGMDFSGREGWSMYHGQSVPGFPQHPHRGFETITVARSGFIDHSDSLGATARFGRGDAQWMTAGKGIVHAEMFPLLNREERNPAELFQLWLNLPGRSKLVDPHFTMFWSESIPTCRFEDEGGRAVEVTLVAGDLGDARAPAPPPGSWAADPAHAVAVWSLKLEAGARWTCPPAPAGATRTLYFFAGAELEVGGTRVRSGQGLRLVPERPAPLHNGEAPSEVLLLQGRPIGEPVAQHGPFVMNSRVELAQAFSDYQQTGFGGWPWGGSAPVHPREQGRFAIHADGRREVPGEAPAPGA